MKQFNKRLASLMTAASVLALSAAARAQETHISNLITLPEVVVTAMRRPELLQDVPVSITAVSEADLKSRGTDDLQSLSQLAPGLNLTAEGVGQNKISMRGVSTGADVGTVQPTVGLYIDDVPTSGSSGGAIDIPFFDVGHIEVLRGPQGTLFGSGSLGGGIRVITNKPDLSSYRAAFDVTGSGTEHGGANRSINLMINIPIVADKLAIRAIGYDRNNSGWIDAINTGATDVNNTHAYGSRVEVEAKPIDRLSVLFTVFNQNVHGGSDGQSLHSTLLPISPALYTASLTNMAQDVKYTAYNAAETFDFDAYRLLVTSTYSTKAQNIRGDYTGYQNLAVLILGLPPSLLGTPEPGVNPTSAHTFTQEVRLTSTADGPLKWTAGGYYQNGSGAAAQTVFSNVISSVLGGLGSLSDLSADIHQTEEAIYGEATYTLDRKWDLTSGLRASRTAIDFVSASKGLLLTGSFSDSPIVVQGSQKENPITPRFSLAYRPTSILTLYAQAARGFRIGGANVTYGLSPGIPPSYDSDSLWNYEVGEKASFLDGRGRLNSSLYYIDWTNIQISTRSSGGVQYIGNAGNAHSYGYELELSALPTSWLQIGGSLQLNRAELSTNSPTLLRPTGIVGAKAGDLLPASAGVTLSSYAQFNFNAWGHSAYVRADHHYVGPEFTDFASTGTRFGNFNQVNLRIGAPIGSCEVVAFVSNVFNSDGATAALDNAAVHGVPTQAQADYRITPRTIGVTLRGAF